VLVHMAQPINYSTTELDFDVKSLMYNSYSTAYSMAVLSQHPIDSLPQLQLELM